MDLALRRLHSCHLSGNWPECSTTRRVQVQVQASTAAVNPPISLSQRALLQTAARRRITQQQGPDGPQEQQQQTQVRLSPDLPGGLFRAHQLADSSVEEFEQLMAEHERQQQLRWRQLQQLQQQQQPAHQRRLQPAPTPQGTQQHQQQQQSQQVSGAFSETPTQLQQRQLLQQQLALHHLLKQKQLQKRRLQLQVRQEPAVLTDLIKRSTSWQRLQQLFATFTPLFNPIHVSAAITHLAQLQEQPLTDQQRVGSHPDLKRLIQELTAAVMACIPDFGPRQLANSMWAIHRLGASKLVARRVRSAFLEAFVGKIKFAAPQHVAMTAAAVANMGWPSSTAWRSSILEAATIRLPYFQPCELAILLHAVARLDLHPSDQWLGGLLSASHSHMYSFSLQELSMLGVSLARLHHRPDQEWLVAYLHAVQQQLTPVASAPGSLWLQSTAQPQGHVFDTHEGLSSSSSSSSSSGAPLKHQSLAAAAAADGVAGASDWQGTILAGDMQQGDASAKMLAERDGAGRFTGVQGLVNVLWALSAWQVTPPGGWQACCVAAAEQLVDQLSIQGASTMLYSFAKLQMQVPQALVLRLLRHAQTLLPSGNSTDVSTLAWALGTMGITAAALAGIPARASTGRGAAAASWGSNGAAGYGSSNSAGTGPGWGADWLDDFMYFSYRLLAGASAEDVTGLLVGAVRMQLRPGAQWLRALLVEAWHHLPAMSPVQLTSTLLCMVQLRCKPSNSFLEAYCTHSEALLAATAAAAGRRTSRRVRQQQQERRSLADARQHYNPQCLANTLGAFALLGYRPPQQWCASFFAASAAQLPNFNGCDFAYTIWALAQLELQPSQAWMDAYLVQLRAHVPTMTSQQLSAVIWALARLNHRPRMDWMNRFLNRVVALTPQQDSPYRSSSSSSGDGTGSVGGGGGSGGSGSAGRPAPPSPLQLSGYFSAIILQGLTAWAASSLELGFDGSSSSRSRSSSSSSTFTISDGCGAGVPFGESVADKKQAAQRRRVGKEKVQHSEAVAEPPCAAVDPSADAGTEDGPSRTVAKDGSITFRF